MWLFFLFSSLFTLLFFTLLLRLFQIKIKREERKEKSIYWLTLLKRTQIIEYDFDEMIALAEEIKRMLIASLNTAKSNQK